MTLTMQLDLDVVKVNQYQSMSEAECKKIQ